MALTRSRSWHHKLIRRLSGFFGVFCCCWKGEIDPTKQESPVKHSNDCPAQDFLSTGDPQQDIQVLTAELQRRLDDLKRARRLSCYQNIVAQRNFDAARPRSRWPFKMGSGGRQSRCSDNYNGQDDRLVEAEAAFSAAMNELSNYFDRVTTSDLHYKSGMNRDCTAPNCRNYHDSKHFEEKQAMPPSPSDEALLSEWYTAASNVRLLYQLLVDLKWSNSGYADDDFKRANVHEKRTHLQQELNVAIAQADQLKVDCLNRGLEIPSP